MLKELLTGLCDLVYPPHCLVCKEHLLTYSPDRVLCGPCHQGIVRNIPPFCPRCSRHLRHPARPYCAECAKTPMHFDFAWAACQYQDPLKHLLHQFKYHQKTYLRELFGRLLTDFIARYHLDTGQFDCLVPIPLHPARYRERGFNQAQLLAEHLARSTKICLDINNLQRARSTEHQTILNAKERWTNVRGAFRIKQPSGFNGKNILIIDDLLTTGATTSEAARTLKSGGANTVGVLTLAITV